MKLTHLVTATAAVALLGGAACAQTKNDVPKAPTPGSVTGDWNGAHAPSDDKQYQEKVTVPVGATTSAEAQAAVNPPAPATTDAAVTADASATAPAATYTSTTVTNGPVPDTAENRAKYGEPMSRAGKRTAARGN
ncbi:MAG: hypothetical protein DI570_06815 [Phenylobacterium zucineum]|nr:MAG: hypothetical protein DI570_06815 [Phenylobacterium zucineum]